ncbi:MAG TPA: exopolysaccharide biosynthesis polyprenyl glycosylphosphotransferase [Solirubrobacteraceae bacterium]|jgi:exopolysaccharide biosynthesis polyprenyl glycosylphosphotransferase|nr:exopolysaccharide biosynthesis polyprenyl glycosylphosphotransferase [Solirubrobacteraceae bacterium]
MAFAGGHDLNGNNYGDIFRAMDGSSPTETAAIPPSELKTLRAAPVAAVRVDRGLGRQVLELTVLSLAGPVLAAAAVAALASDQGTLYEGALLTFLAFLLGGVVFRRETQHTALLPLTGVLFSLAPAAFGAASLVILMTFTGVPAIGAWTLLLAAFTVGVPAVAGRRLLRRERRIRTAVLGVPGSAAMLARELQLAGVGKYVLLGVITPEAVDSEAEEGLPVLGGLGQLGELVEGHRIDLLLMTGSVSRLAVFDEMANSCLHLSVRLWEVTGFYETVFGHVPVAEINASWFQYIMHPRFHAPGGMSKRFFDLLVASLVSPLCFALMAALALLIKRDGGPGFFRQTRIGEQGRPFTVYKLRTMRMGAPDMAQWTTADDPRVTRIGRVLRRTHLDELPQIINVLRGEMSLVGPRPEQPEFVDRLEQTVPYYSRRHLIRPGITGWAQVRCGYAGSDLGSAWKLCHDLYYLKHRSAALDLAIIAETVRTLVADRQYGIEPAGVSFIMRADAPEALTPPVTAAA